MSFSNIVINRITQVNYLFKPFCRQWILINGATNLQTAKGPTDIGLHFGKEKKKDWGKWSGWKDSVGYNLWPLHLIHLLASPRRAQISCRKIYQNSANNCTCPACVLCPVSCRMSWKVTSFQSGILVVDISPPSFRPSWKHLSSPWHIYPAPLRLESLAGLLQEQDTWSTSPGRCLHLIKCWTSCLVRYSRRRRSRRTISITRSRSRTCELSHLS